MAVDEVVRRLPRGEDDDRTGPADQQRRNDRSGWTHQQKLPPSTSLTHTRVPTHHAACRS